MRYLLKADVINELAMYATQDIDEDVDDDYLDDVYITFNHYLTSDLLAELHAAEDACGFPNDDSNAFLAVYNQRISDIENGFTREYTYSQLNNAANAMLQFAIDCYTDDYKYSDEYNAYINVNLH